MADRRGWDYRELTIPLGLRDTARDVEPSYYRIVLEHLRRAGEDGWQADGPIDLNSGLAAGRVRLRRRGIRWTSWGETTYESVTIRLRRPTT